MQVKVHPKKTLFFIFAAFLILLYTVSVGSRDSSVGLDSINYRYAFESTISGGFELGFNIILNSLKYFSTSYHFLFIFIAILTGILFFLAGKILFGARYILLFTVILITFPFFYSVSSNVIRQGLALGIILFTYSVSSKLQSKFNYKLFIVIILSAGIHFPTAAIMLPLAINFRINKILYVWLGLVSISLFGDYYAGFLAQFVSGRFVAYLANDSFIDYTTGFRWQFVLFSAMPIALLLLKKHNEMNLPYRRIFDTYLVINGASLLFNFLPYFDRFLLPSWMMMPFIYTYGMIEINTMRIDHRGKILIRLALFFIVTTASLFVYRLGIG